MTLAGRCPPRHSDSPKQAPQRNQQQQQGEVWEQPAGWRTLSVALSTLVSLTWTQAGPLAWTALTEEAQLSELSGYYEAPASDFD